MSDEAQTWAAKLEQLRQDTRDGIASGEATPLDIEEIKARGRRRLPQSQSLAMSISNGNNN